MPICPRCGSDHVIKNGHIHTGRPKFGWTSDHEGPERRCGTHRPQWTVTELEPSCYYDARPKGWPVTLTLAPVPALLVGGADDADRSATAVTRLAMEVSRLRWVWVLPSWRR
jgi:hypothetical protein